MVGAVRVSSCAGPPLPTHSWGLHPRGKETNVWTKRHLFGKGLNGARRGDTCRREPTHPEGWGVLCRGRPHRQGAGLSPEADSAPPGDANGGDPRVRAFRPRRVGAWARPSRRWRLPGLATPSQPREPRASALPTRARREHKAEPAPGSRIFLHHTGRAAWAPWASKPPARSRRLLWPRL